MTGGRVCYSYTNCAKYLVFRITDGLLCYGGINCNWKLMLECCVCFVAHRVKSNFYVIGVSGCVSVSHWFREEEEKNYKNYLAVISYINTLCKELLSGCLAVKTHGYRPWKYTNAHHSFTRISWQLYIIIPTVAIHYKLFVQPRSNVTSSLFLYSTLW